MTKKIRNTRRNKNPRCAQCNAFVSTGILSPGDLSKNSVVRITDRLDMTPAICCGRRAADQNKNKNWAILKNEMFLYFLTESYMLL